MEKFILELELRYREFKNDEDRYRTPKIVIGIYDSWDEAAKIGNDIIADVLAKEFEVRADDKFIKNYLYGSPLNLVTNTCYPRGKPEYFFRIERFNITNDVETFVTDAIAKYEKYKEWVRNNNE
jgi:hypothetical protein